MLGSSTYVLRQHHVNTNLQFKLSCMLENSTENFVVESSSVIVCSDSSTTAEISTCNQNFTRIHKTSVIKNISSLNQIRVKYNPTDDMITMVYRSKDRIFFYKGQLFNEKESMIARSTLKRQPVSVAFPENFKIIDISNICETVNYGTVCIITTAEGKTYLLQYYNHKLGIFETNPTNKINGFLKLVIAPLFSQKVHIQCSSTLDFINGTEKGTLFYILDDQLSAKTFDLSAGTRQQHYWQQSIKQILPLNTLIIIHKFSRIFQATFLNLVCLVENRISLYSVEVRGKQNFKLVGSIDDLFNFSDNPQQQEQQQGQMQHEGDAKFNIKSDLIEIQQIKDKIYVLCHKSIYQQHVNTHRKAHFLAVIQTTQNNQFTMVERTELNIYGEFKMVKISSEQQSRLLLVGKSACYEILEDESRKIQAEEDMSANSQLNFSENSEKRRQIPSIPSYESKNLEALYQRSSTKINSSDALIENPFSSVKIQKHLSHKDFPQLFRLLNMDKNQFQLQSILENNLSVAIKQVSDYLTTLIILHLFTIQNGLGYSLNIELIKETFKLQIFDDSPERQQQFLREVFINKSFQAMLQIFKSFQEARRYFALYSMCVETIYNCVKTISEFMGENNIKLGFQDDCRTPSERLAFIIQGVSARYLPFFEELMLLLQKKYLQNKEFHSPTADPQVRSKKDASEYQQKQLLDKYLEIKVCCGLDKSKQADGNNSTFKQIISNYVTKTVNFNRFLATMAAKYTNFTILDYLIKSRIVTKKDITDFVSQSFTTDQRSAVLLILKNLINAEIGNIERPQHGRRQNNGLLVLDWIPASFQEQIYNFLITTYPKIGILYGLKTRSRREVAASLIEILNSKSQSVFQSTSDAQAIMNLVECLYDCSNNVQLKVNIDLARVFNKNKQDYHSYRQLKIGNKNMELHSEAWAQLYLNLKKYMPQQEIRQLQSRCRISSMDS